MIGYFDDIKNAKRVVIKKRKNHIIPVEVKIVNMDGTVKIIKYGGEVK